MKKALLKDSIKEIINTHRRFLSILLMAFLGVGFFAGIRATSPDMVDTIDQYYDDQNVYDIQIMSTLGLTAEDLEKIKEIDTVDQVVGTYETDGKIEIENAEVIAKVMCIEEINQPVVLEGRLPENQDECVVEPDFLTANQKQIGDTITIEIENTQNDDGEEVAYLKQKEMKIVGTIQSPLYISKDRGSSSLGSGKVNYYLYINQENVNAKDVYTNIYIKVKKANEEQTSSDEYKEIVQETKDKIEEIKDEREKVRQEELIEKATKKVEEAETEFNEQKEEAQTKIEEAEVKIANGKKELEQAKIEVEENEKKANQEFSSAEAQLQSAKEQINQEETVFYQKEAEANAQFEELENQVLSLQEKLTYVEQGLKVANETYQQILEALKDPNLDEGSLESLLGQKQAVEAKIQALQSNQATLTATIKQIQEGITSGKQELESGRVKLQQAKQELENQGKTYQNTKSSTIAQLEEAKEKIENSEEELLKGEEELSTQKEEADQKLAEAETKLIDARSEIAQIEEPTWYILDREANTGYVSFIQDTQSVENIGVVFPIVFFIVAALISLTSMTRMVEEQRTQIGTLKALGYNQRQIASKYILYASLACVIGGILGMCVGFVLIPSIIWMMYSMMYEIGAISLEFNWTIGGAGLGLIFLCIVGATIYSVVKELRETPAILMRPKSPKMGKRVLLERVTFIWKRLSFSQKVTVRNIFRYKKRFLMTIIGILGCTSLILTGFGLKDSISSIMPSQYEKVFNYDMQINLKSGLTQEQRQEFKQDLENKDEVTKIVETYMTSSTAVNQDLEEDVQIIVPKEEDELDGIINIADLKTKEKVDLNENEICLTDKAAQLLNVKAGDKIILKDADGNEKEVTIGNVVENYIYHYVYMSKELYQNLYQKDYETNVLLLQDNGLDEEKEEELATQIMDQGEVSSISVTSTAIQVMDDTMKSLNYVVVVLIVSAGLLAFVVLYNLSNVNISERIRELATIKVLGFYDREVYNYVTRETILLTLIGIALGLVGGYFLNYFIIGTCEINMLRFSKIIEPLSYLYAILITIAFTLIVNFVTYFALKKIDMIESLKSVE